MQKSLKAFFLLVLLLASATTLFAQSTPWVSAYYPAWAWDNGYTDQEVPWDAITHLIYFSSNPSTTSPYFDSTDAEHSWVPTLVAAARTHGVKPLLCVGGVWGQGQVDMETIATDVNKLRTFVSRACSYAKRKGYAGIDVDWEPPATDTAVANRLLKTFYDTLGTWSPRGLLSIAATQTLYPGEGYTPAAMNAYVDQINQMTYDYGQGQTAGHNAAIHFPNQWPGYSSWTIDDHGPMSLAAMGIKKEKLALGLPFYGRGDFDVTVPGQAKTSYYSPFYNYQDVLENITSSTYHWDDQALVPWLAKSGGLWSGGPSFLSYDDSMSIDKKVQWVKQNGIGGVMIFELRAGWDPSKSTVALRNPLAMSVKKAMGVTTVPLNLPTGTFTASPTILPAGGGSVTLTWTSSKATSASIDNGIGAVALSGSKSVTVTSAATYTLTLTNTDGSTNYYVSVTVDVPIGGAQTVPGKIEAESYVAANNANTQATSDAGGGSIAGLLAAGAWTQYTLNVTSSGVYTVDLRIANNTAGTMVIQNAAGAAMKTFSTPSSGGWGTFETVTDTMILSAGTQTIRVFTASSPTDFNWINFSNGAPAPTAPPAPTLSSPANAAKNIASNATLTWAATTGAAQYQLNVGSDTTFRALSVNDSTITSTSRATSGLANGTKYFWRVRAMNAIGKGSFSAIRSFSTTASAKHYKYSAGTGKLATVTIPAAVAGMLQSGDDIAVFTPAGLCVGAVQWLGTDEVIPVWGDDDATTPVDGMKNNEAYNFRVYRTSEITNVSVTYSQGNGKFTPNASATIASLSVVTSVDENGSLPDGIALGQNYPNPFNPTTNIEVRLAQSGFVTLEVFDILGNTVATLMHGNMQAGTYTVRFDGSGLSSGMYMSRLVSNGKSRISKMVLMK